jgi:hypothetical protein
MRLLETLDEPIMVATFLQAEIDSPRFRRDLLRLIERDRRDRDLIDRPDTADEEENRYRARLLGEFRGYGQNRDLFSRFPENVSWFRYALAREELAQVRYIDYSYWNELSGGSRLPSDAAKNIRAGIEIYGVSNTGFLGMAEALRKGARFPELILVGTHPGTDLVALEGHARLTAYALAPECIPVEVSVLIGFSPDLEPWMALDTAPG